MKVSDCGPYDAKIMLVGEAPGQQEERTGVPFCGPSGNLLKHMLSHSCIRFEDCYVTNVVDVRPPDNNFKYFYEGKVPSQRLLDYQQKLRNKIDSIKPKVVITLGEEALKAVCGKSKLSQYRGTWLSYKNINVLPTYHPAYVLRMYHTHAIVEHDFYKAVYRNPVSWPSIIIQPTLEAVLAWISGCQCRVSFDIETIGKNVRCIGLADNRGAISIPFIKFSSTNLVSGIASSGFVRLSSLQGSDKSSYWSAEDEVRVLDAIDNLFNSGIEVVGHNSIAFDDYVLRREFGLSIKNHYMDTMHAWHCLYSELPNGLDFVMSMLTDYPNYWSELNTSDDLAVWTYNAQDCIVTYDISYKIEDELKNVCVENAKLYI